MVNRRKCVFEIGIRIKGNKKELKSAFYCLAVRACLSFEVKFAAGCLVFRQGRAYVVWLFPINRR